MKLTPALIKRCHRGRRDVGHSGNTIVNLVEKQRPVGHSH